MFQDKESQHLFGIVINFRKNFKVRCEKSQQSTLLVDVIIVAFLWRYKISRENLSSISGIDESKTLAIYYSSVSIAIYIGLLL